MWYDLNCRDRILAWREWRLTLDDMSFENALTETATAWSRVPLVNHYLSVDEPDEWPNPWELINENHYCDLAVCLGMFYTIALSKHKTPTLTMNLYRDIEASTWMHLCQMEEGKYVLNWKHGGIVNNSTLQNTARLVYQYKEIDLADKLG